MQNEDILRKIKKCLRLAESSNEHEAAAAIRQAQALMAKHGLNQDDVSISDITEAHSRAGALARPSLWELQLSHMVASAFRCKLIHSRCGQSARWGFIGRDANPVVAGHAFTQLYRQLKRARQEYIDTHCCRVKATTKTKQADMFCRGWVSAVARQVELHAGQNPDEALIATYLRKTHGEPGELGTTNRHQGKTFTQADAAAFQHGQQTGQAAQLHHGVTGGATQQLTLQQPQAHRRTP